VTDVAVAVCTLVAVAVAVDAVCMLVAVAVAVLWMTDEVRAAGGDGPGIGGAQGRPADRV
jgi:hypothetical protein